METKPKPANAVNTAFDQAVQAVRSGATPDSQAKLLYDQLTDDERLGLLDGDLPFWQGMAEMTTVGYNAHPYIHGAVDRLGIPGTRFIDGPRGCVTGHGTAFPVSMARGATWDLDLEEQVGEVIGQEIRAMGGNFFGGVCINLPRHPAWGRIQETYGDEPFHLGEFGAALTRGTQKYVMACAKHYALNSMENVRFQVDVDIDESDLHDVYLPHFKRCVDEGVAAIMSSYNSVMGEWAGQNEYLLTDVLRKYWDWKGITVTDFVWGMRDGGKALNAGMDLEEPMAQQRAVHLRQQLADGETSWAMVERAGVRLIAAQLRSYAARTEGEFSPEIMANAKARALSRKVGARAMVLLKNDPVQGSPVLPLEPGKVTSIAVIGRLALAANMGDLGSSNVHPPSFVTPLDGIKAAFPGAQICVVSEDDPAAAAEAAKNAQVAIVVAGFTERDEGEYVGSDTMTRPELVALFPPPPAGMEAAMAAPKNEGEGLVIMTSGDEYGGDRASLTLRSVDEKIIQAVAAANPRTVVSIVAAGTVLMEAWRQKVPAIVMMWYAGMEGGHALADVLTGKQNPSGRLPFSIPTSPEHLPYFDRKATKITYDRFHGQRLLDKKGIAPAYPHGFGLSYTTFTIGNVSVSDVTSGGAKVKATVSNTGKRDGQQVVQVYGRRTDGEHAGELWLVGFAVADVPAGKAVAVEVPVSFTPLALWDKNAKTRILPDAKNVVLEVGSFVHDPAATTLNVKH
jgi:beta-glucosidase